MTRLYRYLGIAILWALISTPAILAQEDRQYDPQTDDQAAAQDQSSNDDGYGQPSQAEATPPSQYPSSDNQQPQTPDPPARAARLQYMSGSVSIQPQGQGDWAAGILNRPLTISDNVW